MKRSRSPFFLIPAFAFAQVAWMGLLGLWIYWYVSNYLIFKQVGDKLSPQIVVDSPNVLVFVGGIVLIVLIAVAVFFFFRNLTVQMKLTSLYDNFIANVTHELKSPLSSIQLYLETMTEKDISPEKRKEFFGMMIRDANRLQKLINSILEISQLEQKRIAHTYHIYDADLVVRQLVENSAEQFRLSNSSINVEGELPCKFVIDKDAMQIVFDNLIDNAIKYSTSLPELKVKLYCSAQHVVIEFRDKGIGVSIKDQKKIFQKFLRVHNQNIPNVKGTGLGLYWVKEIMKLHGGKVSVDSEGIYKGTTFKIELPIYQTSRKFYINSLLRQTAKKEKLLERSDGE